MKLLLLILLIQFFSLCNQSTAGIPPEFYFTIRNVHTTNPGNPTDSLLLFDLYMQQSNYGQPGVDPFEYAGCQLVIYYNKAIQPLGKNLYFGYNPPANSNTDLPPGLRFTSFQVDSTYGGLLSTRGLLKAFTFAGSCYENHYINDYPGTKIGTMRLRTSGQKFNPVSADLQFKLSVPDRTNVFYYEPEPASLDSEECKQVISPLPDTLLNHYLNDFVFYPSSIRIDANVLIEGKYDTLLYRLKSTDTISAYLRQSSPPYNILDSATGRLDSIGRTAFLIFRNSPSGSYYLTIRHYQCIEIWTAVPQILERDTLSLFSYIYLFSIGPQLVFGNNMKLLGGPFGSYCLYSGDVNQDGFINLHDVIQILNDGKVFLTGKVPSDLDGNNMVGLTDLLIANNNSVEFVRILKP